MGPEIVHPYVIKACSDIAPTVQPDLTGLQLQRAVFHVKEQRPIQVDTNPVSNHLYSYLIVAFQLERHPVLCQDGHLPALFLDQTAVGYLLVHREATVVVLVLVTEHHTDGIVVQGAQGYRQAEIGPSGLTADKVGAGFVGGMVPFSKVVARLDQKVIRLAANRLSLHLPVRIPAVLSLVILFPGREITGAKIIVQE